MDLIQLLGRERLGTFRIQANKLLCEIDELVVKLDRDSKHNYERAYNNLNAEILTQVRGVQGAIEAYCMTLDRQQRDGIENFQSNDLTASAHQFAKCLPQLMQNPHAKCLVETILGRHTALHWDDIAHSMDGTYHPAPVQPSHESSHHARRDMYGPQPAHHSRSSSYHGERHGYGPQPAEVHQSYHHEATPSRHHQDVPILHNHQEMQYYTTVRQPVTFSGAHMTNSYPPSFYAPTVAVSPWETPHSVMPRC